MARLLCKKCGKISEHDDVPTLFAILTDGDLMTSEEMLKSLADAGYELREIVLN